MAWDASITAPSREEEAVAVDWKAKLLETRTASQQASPHAFQQVVQQVIAAGVPASEVKRFVAEHQDVFGAGAHDQAKKAAEALFDQTSPRLLPSSQTGAGVKAHALRLDPGSALPWFQKATLPTLPSSTLLGALKGKGDVVVVDGERFSASDVAALMQLAA